MARQPRVLRDGFATMLTEGIRELLDGRDAEAEAIFQELDEPRLPRGSDPAPSPFRQARVFLRDRFTCRYCERRTALLPVLSLVSSRFPVQFPCHPNWKMSETHIAYWRDAAACDHVVPLARGGTSDESNLVTACWMCNSMKGGWLLDEIGWSILPITTEAWDGLSAQYPPLCALLPAGKLPIHRRWLRALAEAQAEVASR